MSPLVRDGKTCLRVKGRGGFYIVTFEYCNFKVGATLWSIKMPLSQLGKVTQTARGGGEDMLIASWKLNTECARPHAQEMMSRTILMS